MKQTAGIKTISITPTDGGFADVSAQIEMPGMSCNLTVRMKRKNYDLAGLQKEVIQSAIDTLVQLRDLKDG